MHDWAIFCDIIKIDKNNKNLVANMAARFFLKEDSLTKLRDQSIFLISPEIDLQRQFEILNCELASGKTDQIKIEFKEDLPENSKVMEGKSLLLKSEVAQSIFGIVNDAKEDIINAEVYDEEGKLIGKVIKIAGTSAQEHIVVSSEDKEILIPFVDEIVKSKENNKIFVDLPDGLADLNGA